MPQCPAFTEDLTRPHTIGDKVLGERFSLLVKKILYRNQMREDVVSEFSEIALLQQRYRLFLSSDPSPPTPGKKGLF